jgi:DNA polymerase III psi subunit
MPSSQDQTPTNAVPESFVQEVQQAETGGDAAKLILLSLEVKGAAWEADALSLIAQAQMANPPVEPPGRIVLFTGHRVDSAGRKTPRFPAAKVQVAGDAIKNALEAQQKKNGGDDIIGVAGGANGGDLLFHEVCESLGITTEIALALPPDQFAKASVDSEDPSWKVCFTDQLNCHQDVPVLAQSPDLPEWLEFKKDYDVWQRNNLWLMSIALSFGAPKGALLALWDGQTGDGPGGTEHMVALAKEHDMEFVWLKTKELFGLETQSVSG